jgi:RNA polymerase sigma-54 factor
MDLKTGLWQQQSLRLTMTQELTQAIALLQYSAQELTSFLENKALENPLLTVGNPTYRAPKKKQEKDKMDWIEQIADKSFCFEDYILSQLNIKNISIAQIKIIREIIQNIDESGYMTEDLPELAKKNHIPLDQMEEALAIIQTLEPAGIGARSLQECLILQLQRDHPKNERALAIMKNHFAPFVDRKWKMISKELDISLKEIQDIFDRVKLLNPKPCAGFSAAPTSYIYPDAIIESTESGLSVRLYNDLIPKVSFNEKYYKKFSTNGDRQVCQFLNDKFQDYQWIVKSIEQRKETLMRVITKIIEMQPDFFRKGPHFLKPLTMKEIAQELDVHESTISRAVREKYVQTPVGTFSLKTFFSSMIQTVSEESTSSSQVKNAISVMIEQENKLNPYSDQEIVNHLKNKQGMVISRRTVAKYRDQLGIPSSSKRKRFH